MIVRDYGWTTITESKTEALDSRSEFPDTLQQTQILKSEIPRLLRSSQKDQNSGARTIGQQKLSEFVEVSAVLDNGIGTVLPNSKRSMLLKYLILSNCLAVWSSADARDLVSWVDGVIHHSNLTVRSRQLRSGFNANNRPLCTVN